MSEELKSPLKTIRAHCLDCSGTSKEVELCTVTICKLWPYRFGKAVNRAPRVYTDEQREKLRQRLAASRETVK